MFRNFTTEFYHHIKDFEIDYKLKDHKLYHKILEVIQNTNKIKKLNIKDVSKVSKTEMSDIMKDNIFIGDDIKLYLQQNNFLKIHIQELDINSDIYIYLLKENVNIKLIKSFYRLVHLIKIIRNLSQNTNHLTLQILLTNHEKTFDQNVILGCKHVNSGSCYPGSMITIWRDEEIDKVLIHELIHFVKFDFNHLINPKFFMEKFNLNNVKLNETYTDFLAIIIHTLYLSYLSNINYLVLLNREINFIILQASKICKHFKAQNILDLKGKIMEKSNVCAYYILKASLFTNMNKTLDFYYQNLYFDDRDSEFFNLIKDSLSKPVLNDIISYYLKVLSFIKNDKIMSTLRMTHLQLN